MTKDSISPYLGTVDSAEFLRSMLPHDRIRHVAEQLEIMGRSLAGEVDTTLVAELMLLSSRLDLHVRRQGIAAE